MRILILGANGRVGTQLVKQALEQGNIVTAFVRDKSKMKIEESANLKIFTGNAENKKDLTEAMYKQDAVLSALGGNGLNEDPKRYALRMTNIIEAMKANGVKRIIAIANRGVLQFDENTVIKDKSDFSPEYKNVVEGHWQTYFTLLKSDLDWSVIAPSDIREGEAKKNYRTRKNYHPQNGEYISTGDVAFAMLEELKKNEFLKSRFGIAY
jgi:uncharacterized protein